MIKVDTAGTPVCRLHRSLTALRWTPAFPYIPHPKNPVFLSPFCPRKATDICTSLVTCQCHFYPSYRKSMFWECWVSSNLVLGVRNMSVGSRPVCLCARQKIGCRAETLGPIGVATAHGQPG